MKTTERLRHGVRTGRQERLDLCIWNAQDPRNIGKNSQARVHMHETSTGKKRQW